MQIFSGPKYKHCLQKKEEEAVETVPLANSESGFYSCYFLIPKKDGGLRPIFDHWHLNHSLMRRPFKMLNSKLDDC